MHTANVAAAQPQLGASRNSLRRSRRCQAPVQRVQERRSLCARVQAAAGSSSEQDPWAIDGRLPLISRAPQVTRRGMLSAAAAVACACCAELGISQRAQASSWGYGNPEGIAKWPTVRLIRYGGRSISLRAVRAKTHVLDHLLVGYSGTNISQTQVSPLCASGLIQSPSESLRARRVPRSPVTGTPAGECFAPQRTSPAQGRIALTHTRRIH